MIKISYILPCYNVSRYIVDCLESIYNQGMCEDEFEVICVNDCSTDDTGNKIAEQAKYHTNLSLINHEKNLTAGGARNTGIEYAKGEYIWFVDPDDVIKADSAQTFYFIAKQKEAEILFFNFDGADEQLNITGETKLFSDSDVLSGQTFVTKLFPGQFSKFCIIWRCLFKSEFLKKYNLLYPIMRKAQDIAFLWKAMLYAQRVCSVGIIGYTNRGNPYSVAKMKTNPTVVFSERMLFANEVNKLLLNEKIDIQTPIRKDMTRALKWCVNSNMELLSKMSVEELTKYYELVTDHQEMIRGLTQYMNRKSQFLFSDWGGRKIWLKKVKLLSIIKH